MVGLLKTFADGSTRAKHATNAESENGYAGLGRMVGWALIAQKKSRG